MDNLVIKLQAQNRLTIGIIGAAVAGPVFALQILSHPILSKLYKPIVYDAAPCPDQSENPTSETLQTAGAAVAISPNGLFPLYELGLRYAVEENSCEPPKLRIWRSGYGDPGSGDIKDANAENFHLLYSGAKNAYWNKDIRTGMRTMERRHLQSLLLARLRELGGEINWGMRLTHIKELDNNKIDITFQSGQSRRVDLLVGADGGWSTVRKHVIKARFGDNPAATNRWIPEFMGATGFYGVTRKLDLNKRADADAPADTHGIWLDRGNLSSSPLPNGGVRWDLILPGDLPPIKSATIDNTGPKTG
ncbi:hypothetical protein B0O99DRAFT_593433 [Bisporella sp. PMI_857]|nr:hypothetical protein B0O99DRAFT_593433 [Bisporella sp. PMI_857]